MAMLRMYGIYYGRIAELGLGWIKLVFLFNVKGTWMDW